MRTRTPKSQLDLLSSISLFRGLDRRALERVAALLDEVEVGAGAEITVEGQPGRESFIVVEGWAEVELAGSQICTLGRGSFFGELAMLDRGERTATVRALTPMRLLVVGPGAFTSLLDEPKVAGRMLTEVAARLRAVESTLA